MEYGVLFKKPIAPKLSIEPISLFTFSVTLLLPFFKVPSIRLLCLCISILGDQLRMEVIMNLLNKQPASSKTVFCHFFLLHTIILLLRQGVVADLKADREALVEFAYVVGGGSGLGWNTEAHICSDRAGVKCVGSRVVGLHLPGMGLSGAIPENTIERLDALRALSLENNSLTGWLPSKLINLKSLDVSNNGFDGPIPASLSRFPHSSFVGNALLCGPPLINQPCHRRLRDELDITSYSQLPSSSHPLLSRGLLKSNTKTTKKKESHVVIHIVVPLSVALTILVIVAALWCYCNWEKVKDCCKLNENGL
ncbi:unnamed protein product [Cuscuta epithymum]|uniref:Leucine-rich repeat-containing N-terminal plant-type domain-containing protein n=1 Tax=Cuscuta epithymum TaxID=186058 RepID=A0AAV0DX67_9ASTE|nr:unnamed protein product [Cuscuta epithymum]